MIKRLLLILGVALFLSSCGKDVSYRIEGKLSNLEDETLYAVFENDNYKVVDTISCEKPGQFSLKRNEGDFNTVTIFFDNKKSWTTAYLMKGEKVTITGDALYPALLQVKGGRVNDQLNSFRKSVTPLLKEQADLIKILTSKSSQTNTTEDTDIPSRLTNVNHTLSERAMEYIQEHPDEEASAVLLQYYFMNPDDTRKMDELLAVLSPKLKDFYLIRKMQDYSMKAQRTSLGADAFVMCEKHSAHDRCRVCPQGNLSVSIILLSRVQFLPLLCPVSSYCVPRRSCGIWKEKYCCEIGQMASGGIEM